MSKLGKEKNVYYFFFNWKWKFEVSVSLHAHNYALLLMLCIVFMEVSDHQINFWTCATASMSTVNSLVRFSQNPSLDPCRFKTKFSPEE